jgi:ketosteroid isomerase-like protein
MTSNEQLARDGYEALMRGEAKVVEDLMAPDLTWHWWEHGPWDCHSRDEAMTLIRERMRQGAIGELTEVTEITEGQVVAVTRESATLVTFRDGKVVTMHAYRTKADALEAIETEDRQVSARGRFVEGAGL